MSEDIVERLRGAAIRAKDQDHVIHWMLVEDAADEIERLRADNEHLSRL